MLYTQKGVAPFIYRSRRTVAFGGDAPRSRVVRVFTPSTQPPQSPSLPADEKKLVDGERMDDKSDEYLDRYGNVVDDDDDDDNSKSLHVPPLFSSRRVSSRKSIRSLSEDEYRYASVKSLFINFCARTSSHGIPFVGTSSFFGPWVWGAVFLCALMFFLFQTYWTMADYLQYRTIIEMQLRFEAAPFPAATVCNLNAFKYSELIQYEEIKQGFEYWERVINAREMREQMRQDNTASRKIDMRRKRSDRKLNLVFPIDEGELTGAEYQPVFVRCTCMNTEQCVPNRNPLEVNASVCMCFEDITKGLIWPCYPTTVWTVKKCTQCSISNTCADPDGPHATDVARSNDPIECLCQSISHHCMVHPKDEIKWWNPNNYTIYPVTEPPTMESVDTEEAYGLHDLKDAGAITTQTKENLIFLVAALPRDVRRNLSYALNEFVLQCSFNSKDCNMESDFKLHIDPEYGNCYTFNFNHSVELNTRAGPMYGLRLLLDVHQNDYMPTTEAAGVRIVVHEQDQEPFPDTFGYSAPTGFISSFGLKTKVLHRLDEPYGQCSDVFRPPVYIYDERYSPEGCHRNCFQLKVLEDCKCGDPRYPLPTKQDRHCSAKSLMDRQCLANLTNSQSGYRQVPLKCLRQCKQPCHENVFETAYSAAAWPSVNFKIGVECPAVVEIFNDTQACTEYYRINTAYIEIYYEQLNYETLKETAGYTLVNLFSDFGGNIGLWIGFSVITFLELLEFVCEMGYYVLYVKPIRLHRKLKRRRNHDAEELSTPRVVQHVLYSPRSMRLRERIDDMPPKE